MTVQLINPKATQSGGSISIAEVDGSPSVTDVSLLKMTNGTVVDNADGSVTLTVGTGVGNGDMSGPFASVDGEVALFSGTSGKVLKRASLTGMIKAASGVQQAATAGTDYLAPPSGTAIQKAASGAALVPAVPGTDYLAPIMTTLGDIVYGGSAGVQTRLPGSTNVAKRYMAQVGTGSASAAPTWDSLPLNSNIWYYLRGAASDVSGYKSMASTPLELTPTTLSVAAVNGTGVTLANWITDPNFPALTYIPAGPREFHIHAHQFAGTNSTSIYAEFWEVTAAGVDVQLLSTSEVSAPLGAGEVEYKLYSDNPDTHVMQSSSSRICLRVKANSSGGTAATVHLQYGGTSDSHVAVPRNGLDANTYVPYTGATANIDLGNHDLAMSGALTVTLGSSQQIYIDATAPRLVNRGIMRVQHVAGVEGTRPIYLDVDAGGFGNTHAVAVDFITGAVTSTDSCHAYSVNVDGTSALGGTVHGFSVDVLNTGALSDVYAVAANIGVAPLVQWVGSWSTSTKSFALVTGTGTYTDITTGTNAAFVNNGDYVYVGGDTAFSQLQIPLSVPATSSILPIFEYWNGSSWVTFTPLDNSTGFSDNGIVSWSGIALTGWVQNNVHGFTKNWVRILRTAGSAITETSVQTSNPTSYVWSKEGYLSTKTIAAETLTSTVATGTAPFTVTSTTEVANLRAAKATTLNTTRSIYGNNFDGSAALTGIISSLYGGTGNAFTKFTGPTTTERTFTLPDSSQTLLYSGGALGTPASGALTNCTFPTLNQNTTGTAATVTGAAQTSITSLGTLTGLVLGTAANLTIGAGSTNVAPLKLTTGTNLTSVQAGAFEFDGTKLYFTPTTVRNTVMTMPAIDAPVTVTSGFGTSPVVTSSGVRATRIVCGATPGTNTGVIGLPTAPNGWVVNVTNVTTGGVGKIMQTAFTTNSATFQQFANNNNSLSFAQNDVILITAYAF